MASVIQSVAAKRGEVKPSTDNASPDEMETVWQIKDLYRRASDAMRDRKEMWRKAYRVVHNRAPTRGSHVGLPSPTASEVFPVLAALTGWMTDQETRFQVMPAANPHSQAFQFQSQMARDLSKCLESIWVTHQLPLEVEKIVWDSMIYGAGISKTFWDSGLDEGAGNAKFARVDPFTFYPDPHATNDEDATYFIEQRRMPLGEVERRWPDKAKKLLGDIGIDETEEGPPNLFGKDGRSTPMANPGAITGTGQGPHKAWYSRPGQTRPGGLDQHDADDDMSVTVYECWIKENVKQPAPINDEGEPMGEDILVPQWRVIVVCGNHILMNERAVDLWAHGRHPYTRFVQIEDGAFWGISLVDHLAPAQLAINRLLASLQHHAELCGNPVMLEDACSGISRTKLTNVPGQRLSKTAGSEVGWLEPPDMPQGVQQLVTFWVNEMERISGLSAIVRGATPSGRNAQGVLDAVQESAFVRVRLALRNLERWMAKTSRLMANLVVENYTLPRVVGIMGNDGQQSLLALRGRHFWAPNAAGADPLKFQVWVQAGSALPLSRQARSQEADTLFAMGALDVQGVLDAHDYPDRQLILERMAAAAGVGIEPGPPDGATTSRNRPRVGPG